MPYLASLESPNDLMGFHFETRLAGFFAHFRGGILLPNMPTLTAAGFNDYMY